MLNVTIGVICAISVAIACRLPCVRRSLEHLFRDISYGARQLRRNPAFTLTAVLALGIGVGANITIFLFVNQPRAQSLISQQSPWPVGSISWRASRA